MTYPVSGVLFLLSCYQEKLDLCVDSVIFYHLVIRREMLLMLSWTSRRCLSHLMESCLERNYLTLSIQWYIACLQPTDWRLWFNFVEQHLCYVLSKLLICNVEHCKERTKCCSLTEDLMTANNSKRNSKHQLSWFTFSKIRKMCSFQVVDLQGTVYNGCAQPSFGS